MKRLGADAARHPIGVVSSRTGLPQDLIRAWERRYQAVEPSRGGTGRRLYTDADIERLKLLKRCVGAGRRIGDVAGMSDEVLIELIAEDSTARQALPDAKPVRRVGVDATAEEIVDDALEAISELDKHRFEALLSSAAISLSGPRIRREVLAPLMQRIGDRWQEGSLRVVHEHLATAMVRTFLGTLRNGHTRENAPKVVVTTPSGQHHELGALLAAAAADEAGWSVYYLGPNLPAEEIAAAALQIKASAIALSLAYRDNEHVVADELRKLRTYLGPDFPIFLGGRAVAGLEAALAGANIRLTDELADFQGLLTALDR